LSVAGAARVALSVLFAIALHAQSPTSTPKTPLDSLITKQMADAGIMGLGAAIIVDKQVVFMHGYGFADYARTRPFTPNTIMNVGSIAKPFVGVARMRAVQEGKLALDEDINRYLPFRVVNPNDPHDKMATIFNALWKHGESFRATR
jgi:CubicO group peptidase (beta-lactamase class C family)